MLPVPTDGAGSSSFGPWPKELSAELLTRSFPQFAAGMLVQLMAWIGLSQSCAPFDARFPSPLSNVLPVSVAPADAIRNSSAAARTPVVTPNTQRRRVRRLRNRNAAIGVLSLR